MLSEIRLAFRQLNNSRGFAFVAIVTLALGIGTCTAMFSIIHAVLLKPLPFNDPERLVWIENSGKGGLSSRTSRSDTLMEWRGRNQSFEAIAGYFAFFDYSRLTRTDNAQPERLRGVGVSDNFIPTLGIHILHGRSFTPEECLSPELGNPPAVLLSHHYWQTRFNGDPSVVGQTLTLNNGASTIVGIIAPSFDFAATFSPGSEIELITPFPVTSDTARWGNTLFAIGRLKSGVTIDQARAEFSSITPALSKDLGFGYNAGFKMKLIDEALRGKFRTPFYLLIGSVVCVLAIACVNLSNLLLARLNARRQEFTVRIALGARRSHLARQIVTESLVLSVAGSLLGIPLAIVATGALAQLKTFGVPLLQNASVNPTALLVTVGLSILAGLICSVLPAIHLTRESNQSELQNATQQRSAGRSSALARNSLIVIEVALACVLLIGAGLLIRSFNKLLQIELGFAPQHAAAWRVDAARSFDTLLEANQYYDGIVQRVASLPGVDAVGLSDTLPLGRNRSWGARAKGVEYGPGETPGAFPRIVDDHYLQAMNIPLIAGRYFDERDSAAGEKSVVINESFARRLWPDQNPLGRVILTNGESTVIGVVADVRHDSLEELGGNEMYLNYHQISDFSGLEMVVRSQRALASIAPEIRRTLTEYDPTLPTGEYYALERLIDNAIGPRRLIMQMLGFFSTLALTLAALGLYGVIAYSVVQRTQEIGIRMAIGAQRRDVLQLILTGGLKLVALGVGLGLLAALALTRLLQGLLFGVTAYDPLVFASNAALLFIVATAACILPALRATRVDPIVALRNE